MPSGTSSAERPPRRRVAGHDHGMRRLLLVLAVALVAAGCSGAAPAPPPFPAATADPTDTRVLTPGRGLFTVEVPARFVDVPATAPEAAAVPALAEALQRGVGVLAIDRREGYSPTAGGYCTLVQAQDLTQLAAEAREALQGTGTPVGDVQFGVLPAGGPASPGSPGPTGPSRPGAPSPSSRCPGSPGRAARASSRPRPTTRSATPPS